MNGGLDCIAERYRYAQVCVTIGRGYNYSTAFELSLKLKEMTYTVVEPYSSADFLHGPLALIALGFPVITVAPSGKMLPEMKTFMATAKERGAELIVISDDAGGVGAGPGGVRAAGRRARVALADLRHRARPTAGDAPVAHARLRPRPAARAE